MVNRQAEKPTEAIKFTLTASANAVMDEQLSIRIGTLPAGGIQENGDYVLRLTEPATYQRTVIASLPNGATAFRKLSSPAELTVFWPYHTSYAELSCSSSGGATYGEIEALCNNILQAWTWLQP